jgi:hypothetical protein
MIILNIGKPTADISNINVKLSRYHHAGLRRERKCSSYPFLHSARDGSKQPASWPGRALPLGKRPLVPIGYEAGLAIELLWTQSSYKKNPFPVPVIEIRSPERPVCSQILEEVSNFRRFSS